MATETMDEFMMIINDCYPVSAYKKHYLTARCILAAHGFFTQLGAAAIKHKFIGKPLKIQIFHTKNTPVHWGKIHPIKQEYSLVQRKKFIGMKTRF